eukprot:6040067-Lingulodinium_polyedra.AAC.1
MGVADARTQMACRRISMYQEMIKRPAEHQAYLAAMLACEAGESSPPQHPWVLQFDADVLVASAVEGCAWLADADLRSFLDDPVAAERFVEFG